MNSALPVHFSPGQTGNFNNHVPFNEETKRAIPTGIWPFIEKFTWV